MVCLLVNCDTLFTSHSDILSDTDDYEAEGLTSLGFPWVRYFDWIVRFLLQGPVDNNFHSKLDK